ncbi:MAG: RidA family protein [Pseudomonadota bacterium]
MAKHRISSGSPFEKTAGYSRAVVNGDRCHVAGTTGYDYATMQIPDDVAAQTRNALATVEATLKEAGFALGDVVRARYVLKNADDVDAVFAVLGEVFGEVRPAATMIVADLIKPEIKFEVDVTVER